MQKVRPLLVGCISAAFTATAYAGDPAVVATASGMGSAPTASAATPASSDNTSGQISAWVHANDDGTIQEGGSSASDQPRTIHGEVGVGIGSGFSNEYGVADIPVGKTGDLVVAAFNADAHFRGAGGVRAQSLSVGLFLDGASPSSQSSCGPAAQRYGLGPPPSYRFGLGAGPMGYAPSGAVDNGRQATGCETRKGP